MISFLWETLLQNYGHPIRQYFEGNAIVSIPRFYRMLTPAVESLSVLFLYPS